MGIISFPHTLIKFLLKGLPYLNKKLFCNTIIINVYYSNLFGTVKI